MDQFTGLGDDTSPLSDVLEVIQNDEIRGIAVGNDDVRMEMEEEMSRNACSPLIVHYPQNESVRPYIEILEQPASGIRFRYEIEGRSAGSIPGEHSRPDMKTYPTIRIVGFTGKMLVVVSCVTVEENPNNPPRPHPHKLVGRVEHCKNGVCRVRLKGDNMTVSFPNLGIQCVRRKDVEASLTERQREKVDPFGTGFDHKRSHTNLALNTVRLCFQGFIPRKMNGKVAWEILKPVISNPIIEKKATCTLSIHKLSHYSASAGGGMEMIILCDKVPKDDIQIRFFEERDGLVVWEGYGDFQPSQVHHQYAIAFRTPKYDYSDIKEAVKVNIQLKLKSKDQYGPSLDFQMLPLAIIDGSFKTKRKSPKDLLSETLELNPEKRFKVLDPNLQSFIKIEPNISPIPGINDRVSPNVPIAGPSASPQHLMPFQMDNASERGSPMTAVYNIPFNRNTDNFENQYGFFETPRLNFEQPRMIANIVPNSYMEPSQVLTNISIQPELNLNNREEPSVLDLDNQQLINPAGNRTLELINSLINDGSLSAEFDNSLQISAPATQPEPNPQPSEMSDSLTTLTRNIQSLNELCRNNYFE